jgi:beta-galactosidase
MNRAHLVEGESGQALYLSGHDDWLEIYRDPSLDIEGEQLTISFHVKPEVFNGNAAFLTKGDYQFGIIQKDGAHLEFYLNNGQRVSLTGKVPGDWTGRWHHVAGIYDGRKMELYVDGSLVGTHACRGAILNSPYPVTLGKSAELRDSHMGNMCHATLDQVRIFDQVLSMEELQQEQGSQKERSKLWLDFETSATQGKYWSIGIPGRTYGLVWPDRSVQPELWQLKKSPQPVQFAAVDLLSGRIRVENWHHFRNLEEFAFEWTVTEDGKALQEGTLEVSLPAGDTGYITIPFSMPDARPGSLYHLLVSCKTKTNQPWAKAGHEVAWEQFELPIRVAVVPLAHPEVIPEVEETVDRLIIRGDGFSYTFDRNTGTLSSMVIGGKELVGKGLRFNVWHAPLANELDSWNFWHTDMGYTKEWMGKETANGWRSIGLDRLVQELDRLTRTESDGMVTVTVEASLHASNHTTGFKVHYIYTIYGDGQLSLTTRAIPSGYLTRWIPKMGLKMELPDSFCNLEWLGRGPFETYPDRKTGAKIGHYRTTADEDFVPYIIPQEYGNKTDVSWLKVTDEEGTGIFVSGEVPFNASLQKYTTGHLDRCHYPFQLKDEGVVTLNIDHRVSGVGCTAMSVLNPYQVTPEETTFTFNIKPVL